jgi:deoxyribonuclease-2
MVHHTPMKFIFKNGGLNGSIFEDGLNFMLNASVLAETWGRPLQEPWCVGPYPVGNVRTVTFTQSIQWLETQDHSKWAYGVGTNYSCFGDMNRMSSQWKRGGAFYCIESDVLRMAMEAISTEVNACPDAETVD